MNFLHGSLYQIMACSLNPFVHIPYQTKFPLTKFSTDKIFRGTKFSTLSRNFDNVVQCLPDFCIEILDKIFDGQKF